MADIAKAGKYADSHHRVRLSDEDMDLLVSALRQQKASNLSQARKDRIAELINRLLERRPGRH
jgi:hypothetical protein